MSKPIRWWAVYDARGRFVTARPGRSEAIDDACCRGWIDGCSMSWRGAYRDDWRCKRVLLVEE